MYVSFFRRGLRCAMMLLLLLLVFFISLLQSQLLYIFFVCLSFRWMTEIPNLTKSINLKKNSFHQSQFTYLCMCIVRLFSYCNCRSPNVDYFSSCPLQQKKKPHHIKWLESLECAINDARIIQHLRIAKLN